MSRVLSRASWRFGLRHPWQLGLSLLGIALGVAVVVSIDLAIESSKRAYAVADAALGGEATHRVVGGPSGIPDAAYVAMARTLPAGIGIAPVVEGWVQVNGVRMRLVGLDPFAEAPFARVLSLADAAVSASNPGALLDLLTKPGAVALERGAAQRLGASVGEPLASAAPLQLVAVFEARTALQAESLRGVLLCDIATAQEVLGLVGRLSHIDVRAGSSVANGEDESGEAAVAAALDAVAAALPPDLRLERSGARARSAEQLTRAFHLNLRMLSLLALVVGTFLIYNTLSFAIVQRRELFGCLRALGVTRGEVLWLVGAEAVVLAMVGATAGLALGIVLSEQLVALVSRTLNDLYLAVAVLNVHLTPVSVLKAFSLALLASLAAAAAPAGEASSVSASTALMRSQIEGRARALSVPLAAAGLALMGVSAVLLLVPAGGLGLGFAGLLGVVAGFALLTPWLTRRALALLGVVAGALAGRVGAMSMRDAAASLSRTAVAVTALTVALAAVVGVGVMVDSFRRTVADWLDTTLQADIYVSARGGGLARALEPSLRGTIEALPGVAVISTGASVRVAGDGGPVELIALEMAPESYDGFHIVAGDEHTVWPAFDERGEVLVSEPYAYRLGLVPGGTVTLATDFGQRRLPVAGVYRDYDTDGGSVLMSRKTFTRHYRDRRVTGVGIYIADGADEHEVIARLENVIAPYPNARVIASRRLKTLSLEVFDRTFTITEVLRWLSALIAFCGIVGALMGLALERGREMAVLRAIGLRRGELWLMTQAQTGALGLVAGVLSLPLGLCMAVILVHVINRRSFGWTMELHLDPAIAVHSVAMAVVAALLAGVYPAWRMSSAPPAAALRAD